MSDRVAFTCNGDPVDVEVEAGESLLSVLRERLGIVSVKDGCAPQGQCGCCTVLVDG
ncbi:MAG TPA: 2Fe-2S iron-sulfur cluster-binding protein, partial [Acidimicrobiia bacterium]|nr:2Fe-2S iron-sulfur cluster-binding protein [Acidimicrobiia bacterium]